MNSQEILESLINSNVSESVKLEVLDRIDELFGLGKKSSVRDAIGLASINMANYKTITGPRKEAQKSKVKAEQPKTSTPATKPEIKPEIKPEVKAEQPKTESDVAKRTRELIEKQRQALKNAGGRDWSSLINSKTQNLNNKVSNETRKDINNKIKNNIKKSQEQQQPKTLTPATKSEVKVEPQKVVQQKLNLETPVEKAETSTPVTKPEVKQEVKAEQPKPKRAYYRSSKFKRKRKKVKSTTKADSEKLIKK